MLRRYFAEVCRCISDLKYQRMFGDCSANIPRLVADHRRIFAKYISRQNIANGSRKISMLENFGHREMLPHKYHEFRLFTEGSVIPPEHRLMSISIGNASASLKSPVGPSHYIAHIQDLVCWLVHIHIRSIVLRIIHV